MWGSGIGKNIATYVIYIAKLRDGFKRVTKFFSNQFRGRVKMKREREWTHTKRFEVEIFFSSNDIHPFIMRDVLELFSLFLFLSFFNTFSFSLTLF
jgi:hypothetical protein